MSPYVKKVKQKKILQQIVIFFLNLVLVFPFYRDFFYVNILKSIDFYMKINYAINKFKFKFELIHSAE